MKAVGIIAEYNPFHNGHLYHLNKIKELYKDYTIVLVMSGNFTQRGEASIIDKWKKTEIAKQAGIDLIIELPFPFATQSADYFSFGAITILEYLGVERVIFGSESNNIKDLELIVDTQLNNEDFDKLIKIYSKFGHNYPTALSLALKDLTNKTISTPNDLLGISYIKAIKKNNYKIIPETIKRTGSYHDEELKEHSSATAIRKALKENISVTEFLPKITTKNLTNLHFIEDYYCFLKYKVLTTPDLSIYQTVDDGLAKALKKEITLANSYNELVKNLKSKRHTYNKITRMLLHILCDFTKEKAKTFNSITYIRILGFNDQGRLYLNSVKKKVPVPIISKINRTKDPMLEYEIFTTTIYALTLPPEKEKELNYQEYKNLMNKGE